MALKGKSDGPSVLRCPRNGKRRLYRHAGVTTTGLSTREGTQVYRQPGDLPVANDWCCGGLHRQALSAPACAVLRLCLLSSKHCGFEVSVLAIQSLLSPDTALCDSLNPALLLRPSYRLHPILWGSAGLGVCAGKCKRIGKFPRPCVAPREWLLQGALNHS